VLSTAGLIGEGLYASASNAQVQRTRLAYEKLIASHDARMIAAVDKVTQSRTGRLRETLQQVGVNPDTLKKAARDAEGGPLISANDRKDIGPMADHPESFEQHVQRAARDILDMRRLGEASSGLPLSRPTTSTGESSGYGVRSDPFTGRPAFHPGLDFPAPAMTPVFATAPGVIIFTGGRAGYGSTIEIDHGGGFKTRFAHLAAISVKVGEHVANHQRIGAVGSTGRSTGAHLHYEVWRDGRPQDPERFLKAGEYVQQTG
jgi:murein DD-endopeptidase MepM/ murein hydrolase activator NlpD